MRGFGKISAAVLIIMSTSMVAWAEETKRIALQLSEGSTEKQELTLNIANNLLKAYGPNRVKIEIVAFGPGLRLLLAGNANRDRVQNLALTGVQFSACENTLEAMTKQLGRTPQLDSHAQRVPAGVVRLVELADNGYAVIHP